jgi:uncharacterized protein
MPTRSLRSSVLAWPDRATVEAALRSWTEAARADRPELRAVGYFGSYARDEWGPGSDLDLILIADDDAPFERRAPRWDLTALPVPAEALIYTPAEWQTVLARGDRFARMLERDVVWVMERGSADQG